MTATTTTNVAHLEVYHGVVTRTNIEINDVLVDRAMRLYRLRSKREAVDFALRKLVGERMTRAEMVEAEFAAWLSSAHRHEIK